MAKPVNWESRIGRRLRLRDLHIFFGVVQWGSMAKAAKELGMSQPTVSEVIAELEHTLGVPLFERSPKGVQLTHYGRALHARANSAFDELRQGVRDIEFLADPTVGEIRMACPESIAAGFLPDVIAEFARDHPRVALHVEQVVTPTFEFPELRARKFDFVIARVARAEAAPDDELEIETLFEEDIVVVAGAQSRWAGNPNLDLADLIDAPWVYGDKNTWGRDWITEAFRARGLREPANVVTTLSVHLRFHLAARGEHVTYIPRSILRVSQERFGLCILPVRLPRHGLVAIVTLKQRTLSPVVTLFLDRLRAYVRSNALPRRLDVREVSVPPLA
jgi:DNA-binding transcriptional LysR family regulator